MERAPSRISIAGLRRYTGGHCDRVELGRCVGRSLFGLHDEYAVPVILGRLFDKVLATINVEFRRAVVRIDFQHFLKR